MQKVNANGAQGMGTRFHAIRHAGSNVGPFGRRGMELLELALFCALAIVLVVSGASDLRSRTIPNACSFVAAALGIARAILASELFDALAGMAVVAVVLLATNAVFFRVRGERGVGGGDVKLFSALGFWTGPKGGLLLVALACAFGLIGKAVSSIAYAFSGHKSVISPQKTTVGGIPMAPAIGLAALVVLLLNTN